MPVVIGGALLQTIIRSWVIDQKIKESLMSKAKESLQGVATIRDLSRRALSEILQEKMCMVYPQCGLPAEVCIHSIADDDRWSSCVWAAVFVAIDLSGQ